MARPLIGVTTYRKSGDRAYVYVSLAENYVQALLQAGALPLLIPLNVPDDGLRPILDRIHGLLLTGGGDVNPARYRGRPHPQIDGIDDDRDRIEIALVRKAIEMGMPFLGICRGMQVVNVALGGTLYADLADEFSRTLRHDYQKEPAELPTFLAHTVRVAAGRQLAQILGEPVHRVNSLHHQAVRAMAPGFAPTAYAPDGLVEAMEGLDYPYGLAVQWHPEWLTDQPPMRALFRSLVEAATP